MNQEEQTTELRRHNEVDNGEAVHRETVRTNTTNNADNRVVMSRVIWYIAGFIIVLLAIRVIMLMLGANRSAPFVDFMYAVTNLFSAPFAGIFQAPSYNGTFFLDTASLVAMVVYALIAWGISKLFTLSTRSGQA